MQQCTFLVYAIVSQRNTSRHSHGTERFVHARSRILHDILAPGQDIIAATSPFSGSRGQHEAVLSGTSMAAPHMAGVVALLAQAHPKWSPMAFKSSVMTSAVPTQISKVPGDSDSVSPFAQGAGMVQPTAALQPGLVYDSDIDDWTALLCAAEEVARDSPQCNAKACKRAANPGSCTSVSNFNSPSIAMGKFVAAEAVTRTVTSVGASTATYTLDQQLTAAPDGFAMTVQPKSFSIKPGAKMSFSVMLTRTTANYTSGAWSHSQLVWRSGTTTVRSPISVQAFPLSAPEELSFRKGSSSLSVSVQFGYTGADTRAAVA